MFTFEKTQETDDYWTKCLGLFSSHLTRFNCSLPRLNFTKLSVHLVKLKTRKSLRVLVLKMMSTRGARTWWNALWIAPMCHYSFLELSINSSRRKTRDQAIKHVLLPRQALFWSTILSVTGLVPVILMAVIISHCSSWTKHAVWICAVRRNCFICQCCCHYRGSWGSTSHSLAIRNCEWRTDGDQDVNTSFLLLLLTASLSVWPVRDESREKRETTRVEHFVKEKER